MALREEAEEEAGAHFCNWNVDELLLWLPPESKLLPLDVVM